MYEELRLELIGKTLDGLVSRIEERFPGSGLGQVGRELQQICAVTGQVVEEVRRPRRALRIGVAAAILLLIAIPIALLVAVQPASMRFDSFSDLLQTIESGAQDAIFIGIAVYFLLSVEARLNRRVSLQALRRLRSIVHIVDMHQLTKDPEHLLTPGRRTPSSPEREFTRFELSRYLDYCAELLSISSKLAALHAQHLNDPVVLEAVSDIEGLASSLSNKMWQKIVILDTVVQTDVSR
jgi:hypothetical protein